MTEKLIPGVRITTLPKRRLMAGDSLADQAKNVVEFPKGRRRQGQAQADATAAPSEPPYQTKGGKIWCCTGQYPYPLCNFVAEIVQQTLVDDGSGDGVLKFIIKSRDFPDITVPAKDYDAMAWVTERWGAQAIIYATRRDNKANLAAAIKFLSNPKKITAHTSLGWRQFDGVWCYVHADGAIGGNDEVVTDLGTTLENFRLPALPKHNAKLIEAVRASLRLQYVADDRASIPMLAAAWRAPLEHFAPAGCSVFAMGPTQTGKSTLAALVQAHYGATMSTPKTLPCNFSSTANMLEEIAYRAKDSLLVPDDFLSLPPGRDADAQQRTGERLFRGKSNSSGRGRLNRDLSIRDGHPPRAMLLATGEVLPTGQSLQNRLFVVPFTKKTVDFDKVSAAQADARSGLYALAMAGYIDYLRQRVTTDGAGQFAKRLDTLRDKARRDGFGRVSDHVADLMLGVETFMDFALTVKAIETTGTDAFERAAWAALRANADEQREEAREAEPATRFVQLLRTVIHSRQAHLADPENNGEPLIKPELFGWDSRKISGGDAGPVEVWDAKGARIGWINKKHLLLDPGAAYAAVRRQAQAENAPLLLTDRQLWKALDESKMLFKDQPDRLVCKATIAGARKVGLLRLDASVVFEWDSAGNRREEEG